MNSKQKQQHVRSIVAAILLLLSIHDGAQAFAPGRQTHLVTTRSSNKFFVSRLRDKSNGIEPYTDNEAVSLQSKVQTEVHDLVSRATGRTRKSTDPTPSLVLAAQNIVGLLKDVKKNQAAFAAMSALAVALTMTPLPSEAAMSGGRMGGSYSSPRSSSRPSYTRQSSSYGGGGYSRGLGTGFAAGYGAGAFSRPSYVTPFYSPFSLFPRPYYSPGYVVGVSQGPGILPFIIFAGAVLAINLSYPGGEEGGFGSSLLGQTSVLGSGTSVIKLTIALEVSDRDDRNSILSVLNRLATTAKTNSRVGIQNLTSQVALELLRRKSSIVSASSKFKHFSDRTKASREYNNQSIQERGKFESETVSNYGGVDYTGRGAGSSVGDSKATMAVVTLLLAIDGDSTAVPQISSIADIETALRKIASDSKVDDCLQSAEILWTPEERYETLSPRDIIADYPELRSI